MTRFNSFILHFLLGWEVLLYSSSCTLRRLDVQTQYLNHEYLASYHVGTPDPRLHETIMGQRLLVQWSLRAHEIEGQEMFLDLKVRFRNHQEQEIRVPISAKRGTYLYEVTDETYCQSGGILTYLVEIRTSTNCLLASWKHPLWTDLIKFHFSNLKTGT